MKSYNNYPIDTINYYKDSVSKIICKEYKLITSSLDGNVRTFDIRMGELTTDNFGTGIHSMWVANDEQSYIVSSLDNYKKLVEKKGGEIL